MSGEGGYEISVKIDDRQFREQVKRIQDIFTNAQRQFQQAIPPQMQKQIAHANTMMAGGQQQVQETNKQTTLFQQMRDDLGEISKNAVALAGIGVGLAGITKLMLDASPALQGTFKLLQHTVTMILRPIANVISMLIRPIIIEFYRKIVIPYHEFMSALTPGIGAKIAEFYNNPSLVLAGLATAIGGAVAISLAGRVGIPSGGAAPAPGTGPGGAGGAAGAARCMELCNKTIESLNRGTAGALSESLKGLIAIIVGGTAGSVIGGLFGPSISKAHERTLKESLEMATSAQMMSAQIDRSAENTVGINSSVARMRQQFEDSTARAAEVAEFNRQIQERYAESAFSSKSLPEEVGKMNESAKEASGEWSGVAAASAVVATTAAVIIANWDKASILFSGFVSRLAAMGGPILTNPAIISELTGFGAPQAFAEEVSNKAKRGSKIDVESIRREYGDAAGDMAQQFASSSSRSSGGGSSSLSIKAGSTVKGHAPEGSALKGKSFKFGSINVKFAEGGTILEPTALFGLRSGGVGLMAEKGPERIVPTGGGMRPFVIEKIIGEVHIHNNADIDRLVNQIEARIKRLIGSTLQIGNNRAGNI